jgi:hypothetical protein
MTSHTAKAIKDILAALDYYYGTREGVVYSKQKWRDVLERALHDFAEAIKLDAIEP